MWDFQNLLKLHIFFLVLSAQALVILLDKHGVVVEIWTTLVTFWPDFNIFNERLDLPLESCPLEV